MVDQASRDLCAPNIDANDKPISSRSVCGHSFLRLARTLGHACLILRIFCAPFRHACFWRACFCSVASGQPIALAPGPRIATAMANHSCDRVISTHDREQVRALWWGDFAATKRDLMRRSFSPAYIAPTRPASSAAEPHKLPDSWGIARNTLGAPPDERTCRWL
jgi:hypothetical protein